MVVSIDSRAAVAAAKSFVKADPDSAVRAWRVTRLDRACAFYYLVLIEGSGGSAQVVMIDGESGAAESSARVASGEGPVSIPPEQASRLAKLHPADEVDLAWMACDATRSPLYPLWRVRRGKEIRYVDQRGAVRKELGGDRRGG